VKTSEVEDVSEYTLSSTGKAALSNRSAEVAIALPA